MSNQVFPEYKEFLLAASANVSLNVDDATDGPFVRLVDTGAYTYDAAHNFADDVTGAIGTDQRITAPTVANGTFDGDDVAFTAVSGNSVEALVIYRKNSGANTTWKLVLFEDTGVTGLPVTPNGGNISIAWHASGIFTISDARAKENIRQIGSVKGRLAVCEFNYRGQRGREIGLMAQDVERKVPGAVVQMGHRKVVNYGKALEWAMAA